MTKKQRKAAVYAAVLQTYAEIDDEKRGAGKRAWVYWIDDKVAIRVFAILGWKPSRYQAINEKRMRQISGTVSSLIKSGNLTVMTHAPHGNRALRVN